MSGLIKTFAEFDGNVWPFQRCFWRHESYGHVHMLFIARQQPTRAMSSFTFACKMCAVLALSLHLLSTLEKRKCFSIWTSAIASSNNSSESTRTTSSTMSSFGQSYFSVQYISHFVFFRGWFSFQWILLPFIILARDPLASAIIS